MRGGGSHTRLLVRLLGVCLIVAYAYLLSGCYQQGKVQAAIINQTGTSRRALELIAAPPGGLEEQLAQVRAANQAAEQAVRPDRINTTDIIAAILQDAGACNLKANPLTADAWQKRSIGNSTYRTLDLGLDLEGQQADLTRFLGELDDREKFPSLGIEGLSIGWSEGTVGTGQVEESQEVTAKLTVTIIERLGSGS